ncbi:hypothetical protein MSBR2_0356 [Methanosarcina barkeri 227]|uniref:Uncharacterized protein n=2 Tax=Methanosarcina barkeri TaxID=2208 RepID=A0A0E3QUI1_METBA|nr:hypothetical protein MSBRM_2060 [Methanosarcina barkeri MS]AKB56872.1 hypothetical protein MSBR2_0356 [Methanosarcina barkeri 227]
MEVYQGYSYIISIWLIYRHNFNLAYIQLHNFNLAHIQLHNFNHSRHLTIESGKCYGDELKEDIQINSKIGLSTNVGTEFAS